MKYTPKFLRLLTPVRPLIESTDYRGEHTAPDKDFGSQLSDVEEMFPDIYGPHGIRYYGDGSDFAALTVGIIQRYRGQPNRPIKIYRSVPDLDHALTSEIKTLKKLLDYYDQFNFFPVGNLLIRNIEEEISQNNPTLSYDDLKGATLKAVIQKLRALYDQRNPPLRINDGDWVAITRDYAREHGRSHLNNKFKILTKTVKAATLYTDGSSIHEWGYNE